MYIEQKKWTRKGTWQGTKKTQTDAQLVFVFGGREEVEMPERFYELKEFYPNADILMCSTAGEIIGTTVLDHSLCTTAITFKDTTISYTQAQITDAADSEQKGAQLATALEKKGLVHVMVFSDGLMVNGTQLVAGLSKNLPDDVAITGGLVGDGPDFKKTVVGINQVPIAKNIVLIGFYSDSLQVSYGSVGGWDVFGPERIITKSEGNVLYELDGKPALDVYTRYLGEEAQNLPSAGLLFPLNIRTDESDDGVEVVRTLLGVDHTQKSMTFAGDMPEGAHTKLMRANFERLIDGAAEAAKRSSDASGLADTQLTILISCVGRKLVLQDRIEEEVEAVRDIVGSQSALTGFYSYGEISPVAPTEKQCRLHNQTMTITTFKE